MNREIHFRAWNGSHLLDWGWICAMGMVSQVLLNTEGYYQIMQFTGLFDKNGKEIYEGDIVKGAKLKKPYQIIFLRGSFDINNPSCCKHCKAGNACHGSLNELLASYDDIEVIGNRFDNPELLEVAA